MYYQTYSTILLLAGQLKVQVNLCSRKYAIFDEENVSRLGKIEEGNTSLDYDPEEVKRKSSVLTAVAPVEWKNTKINLIDTPGLFDFAGGIAEGMTAAEVC